MTKEKSHQEDDWVPCQPGQIARIAADQKALDRRLAMSKMAVGVVAFVSLGTASAIYFASDKNKPVDSNDLVNTNDHVNTKVADDGIRAVKDDTKFVEEEIASISCREVVGLLPKYLAEKIKCVKLIARVDKHLGHCNWCCDRRDELKF